MPENEKLEVEIEVTGTELATREMHQLQRAVDDAGGAMSQMSNRQTQALSAALSGVEDVIRSTAGQLLGFATVSGAATAALVAGISAIQNYDEAMRHLQTTTANAKELGNIKTAVEMTGHKFNPSVAQTVQYLQKGRAGMGIKESGQASKSAIEYVTKYIDQGSWWSRLRRGTTDTQDKIVNSLAHLAVGYGGKTPDEINSVISSMISAMQTYGIDYETLKDALYKPSVQAKVWESGMPVSTWIDMIGRSYQGGNEISPESILDWISSSANNTWQSQWARATQPLSIISSASEITPEVRDAWKRLYGTNKIDEAEFKRIRDRLRYIEPNSYEYYDEMISAAERQGLDIKSIMSKGGMKNFYAEAMERFKENNPSYWMSIGANAVDLQGMSQFSESQNRTAEYKAKEAELMKRGLYNRELPDIINGLNRVLGQNVLELPIQYDEFGSRANWHEIYSLVNPSELSDDEILTRIAITLKSIDDLLHRIDEDVKANGGVMPESVRSPYDEIIRYRDRLQKLK